VKAITGFALSLVVAAPLGSYPLDGYSSTGIRRLLGYRLAYEGKLQSGLRLPEGALLNENDVRLRLRGVNDDFDVSASTPKNPELQSGLDQIAAELDPSYSIALLEISDPKNPRYAAIRPEVKRIPGSVGKLLVATGFFDALRLRFPGEVAARQEFVKSTLITADSFVHLDGKTVPFFNEGDDQVKRRRIEIGDRFSLYEWLDHMLSPSSNASGSTVWKQAMLFREFGARYPLAPEAEEEFLKTTPKMELQRRSLEALAAPLRDAGINTDNLRLGTYFTRNASAVIPGTSSYGNPLELMRWLVRLEQGKIVDEWSSLELKKLIYFSRRRYRYASSPALNKAAVYFKSGSLYNCQEEAGYTCRQYEGNKRNLMHSVAIVESGEKAYLVTMMSNVLKKNSAVEHQTIATRIERLIQGL